MTLSTWKLSHQITAEIKRAKENGRSDALQEAVDLSDTIEEQTPSTEFAEWRAFKRFRNTLRDKLKQL